jgi:hypothetical protein
MSHPSADAIVPEIKCIRSESVQLPSSMRAIWFRTSSDMVSDRIVATSKTCSVIEGYSSNVVWVMRVCSAAIKAICCDCVALRSHAAHCAAARRRSAVSLTFVSGRQQSWASRLTIRTFR